MAPPVHVPLYVTVSAPLTAPNVIWLPDNVPVMVADEMQAEPVIRIVPLRLDPLCWKFSVKPPARPT
jgi:hypothetical protein